MVEEITGRLPTVFRNDEIELEAIDSYDLIILSPGPGIPDEAGILKDMQVRNLFLVFVLVCKPSWRCLAEPL